MALPALRARLGLGLGRSCATGIAKIVGGGNGSVNYGKTMSTNAAPRDVAGDITPRQLWGLAKGLSIVYMAFYVFRMERKVDQLQRTVDRHGQPRGLYR